MPYTQDSSTSQSTPHWEGDIAHTKIVFYQGRDSTQTHAAMYLGDQLMITTTGEVAYYPYPSILTIPRTSLWVYPELRKVDLSSNHNINPYFSIKRWIQGIQVSTSAHDYTPTYPIDEAGSLQYYSIDRTKCSLGQVTDIADHRKKLEALITNSTEKQNMILYGVSRGAATTFASLANYQYSNVKLCVLEGVPSSMNGIFKSYAYHRDFGKQLYHHLGTRILGHQHQTDKAHQARAYVDRFPNDVPLVIISSIKDETVPHENSIRLALRVAAKRIKTQKGGQNIAPVYFLQLDKVRHNAYGTHNTDDALRYQSFMHAVYQKHELPFIKAYAEQCKDNLVLADLTSERWQDQMQFQIQYWHNKTDREHIRADALQALKQQLTNSDLSPDDKARLVSLSKALPMYSKNHHSRWLFWSTPAQNELTHLQKTDEPTLLEGYCLSIV